MENSINKIELIVPFKTPSVNHLYGLGRYGQKYLKPEAKKLRKEMFSEFNQPLTDCKWILDEEQKLLVQVDIHEDWFTKKGTIKRKDVANREKFLIDSIFEYLEIDDRRIFTYITNKIQSKEEKSRIIIKPYENTK